MQKDINLSLTTTLKLKIHTKQINFLMRHQNGGFV